MPTLRAPAEDLLSTDRAQGKSSLASAAADFRDVFDSMPQLGWTARPDGTIDFYNRAWYAYTGDTAGGMLGVGASHAQDLDALPESGLRWADSLRTGAGFELELPLRRHDGELRWFSSSVYPTRDAAGDIVRWVGVHTDIHLQRSVGDAREELYRSLVEGIPDFAILMLDVEGCVATWNRGAHRALGYAAEDIIGRHFSLFYSPEDVAAEKPRQELEEATLVGRFAEEGWRLRQDGSRFWASSVVTALRDESGALRGFAKVTQDCTARKALQDEEERWKEIREERDQLYALTADLVGIVGFDGRFRRVSPSWEKTLGWTEQELTSRPWLSFVHPEDVETTVLAGTNGPIGGSITCFENRYRCKDGAYRWLEWRSVPLLAKGVIYCIARDVTDARNADEATLKLQKRLVVADRMVSVGTLAAGVAHEINNPLSYVTANLGLLLEEIRCLAGGSSSGRMKELEDIAHEALEGAERVRKIVRGLKTFSRADDERRVVLDVKPALELAINMASNEIRHRACLVKDYGPIPFIEADDARLGQVFLNLLVNAAQAIPAGNADANEIRIVTSTDARGNAVVEIRDTGPGIPEEVRSRMFEPFFTTKGVGVGTGLGLSICHNIVAGMGGEISVASELGRGTSFRLVFVPAGAQKLPREVSSPRLPALGAHGSVLVVDDEPAIGIVMQRVLAAHDVTVVPSATEALALIAGGRSFDVIFSDLMMPQMTGIDLYHELLRVSPAHASRMVFVSGGAFTPGSAEFLENVVNERIEKPFTPAALRAMAARFTK